MSEYVDDTGFLESIIKIEPEEFETIQEKATDHVLEPKHPKTSEQLELTAGSDRDSVELLLRKGNKGKVSRDPHLCCICQKLLSCRQAVREHLERFHLQTKQMSCDLCPKIVFTRDAMIRHLRLTHGKEKFACNQCDYEATRKSALESHKLSHKAKTECPICSKQVTFLKNHMRDHKTKVSCPICQKALPQRCMTRHMKTHALKKCNDCEETFESSDKLRRHKLRHHYEGQIRECHCGSVFSSKAALRKHQQSHEAKKPTCDVCQKEFYSKTNLKFHRKTQHGRSEEKIKVLNTSGPFIWDKCGTKFSSRASFQHHILNYRSATMFCDLCPRSFNQKFLLASHITRDHLKLRPYQCDLCQHKASSRSNLETHKLRHGSNTECRVCRKEVTNMSEHLRNHVKVKCSICGKIYSKNYLSQHMKIHTKAR